jgi:septal ring factor EnvC (AmiA/AmiB activator)
LDEKFEVLIEMLKNRKDTLAKSVKSHYKKQEIYLLEAQKNVERRASNLQKIEAKLEKLVQSNPQNENKLERLESDFSNTNKNYDAPFHQFKHCNVSLHLQSKFYLPS